MHLIEIDWVVVRQLWVEAWQAGYITTGLLWLVIFCYGVSRGRLYEQYLVRKRERYDTPTADEEVEEEECDTESKLVATLTAELSRTREDGSFVSKELLSQQKAEVRWLRKRLKTLLRLALTPAVVVQSPPGALTLPDDWAKRTADKLRTPPDKTKEQAEPANSSPHSCGR